MKKILITGVSGYIGKHLLPVLVEEFEISVFDKNMPSLKEKVKFFPGDLKDYGDILKALSGIEAVIHLAAVTGGKETFPTFETNIRGTYNLAEAVIHKGVKKIIFASSIAAYGCLEKDWYPEYLPVDENHPCRPQDAYGLSKYLGEKILRFYSRKENLEVITLRFAGVYDPSIFDPLHIRKEGKSVLWSLIDVRDVIEGIKLALKTPLKGYQVFNLASREIWAEEDTLELVKRHYPQVRLVFGEEYFQKNRRATLFNIEKAEKILGFKPLYELTNYKQGGA